MYDEYGLIFTFVFPFAPTLTLRAYARRAATPPIDDRAVAVAVAVAVAARAVVAVTIAVDANARHRARAASTAPVDDSRARAGASAARRTTRDVVARADASARRATAASMTRPSLQTRSRRRRRRRRRRPATARAMAHVALALVALVALARATTRDEGEALRRAEDARAAERRGRTTAERALREARLELERCRRAMDARGGATRARASTSHEMTAMGTFASAFDRRLGTPRQPSLVPLARGRVELDARVPASALEGLDEFTHCWLVYVFHENTDLGAGAEKNGKVGAADGPKSTLRGKIRVPRLNGEKRGCLATRTPHRPCPIGLSLVRIVRVNGKSLDVAGADLVHGTPVLDVKPYVPYSDCVVDARAPEWVGNDLADGDGPLTVDEVKLTDAGEAALRAAWERRRKDSLYESADEFVAFVTQALGRDIRSYHQRLGDVAPDTDWRVSLDGVIVVYRQSAKRVVVVGAEN